LCRFFRSFFLRLWVAIFRSLRFLPQGTSGLLDHGITKAAKAAPDIRNSMRQKTKKVKADTGPLQILFLHKTQKKGGAFPDHKRHTAALAVAPPFASALPQSGNAFATPL
jgi:hypothetical protein